MQITEFDDLPFHQAPLPFHIPWTSDVHFNDGYIVAVYDAGRYLLAGIRLHPNMNVIDGFATLSADGEQRCVRFSRALRPDAGDLAIGPLSFRPLEPMRRMRMTLADSPAGFGFDLELETVGEPFLEAPYQHRRHGHLVNDLIRYTMPLRATGSLGCDGRTVAVDRWHGMRDHSWGIRANMGPRTAHGGIALGAEEEDRRAFRLWVPFEVEGHSGFFHTHEDADGRALDCEGHIVFADGRSIGVASVAHEIEYVAGTKNPARGRFRLTDTMGGVREYAFEVTGTPATVQGCGYYGGWRDGDGNGVWRGVGPVTETDRFPAGGDVRNAGPAHLPEKRRIGLTEFGVRLTGPDGAAGMAHFEHTVMGPYRPYGFG